MLEVINQQRKIKINRQVFQDFADILIQQISETKNKSATVAFVSDRKMRKLNRDFRGKNSTTDVLSFPFEVDDFGLITEPSISANTYLGDIAISVEQAERQAIENNLDFETEIKQLILHGVLHLCGYDHEQDAGEMSELELQFRDKLGIK